MTVRAGIVVVRVAQEAKEPEKCVHSYLKIILFN